MIFFCCIPDIGETISVIEGILPVGMYVLQGCSLCGCVLAVNREFIISVVAIAMWIKFSLEGLAIHAFRQLSSILPRITHKS